MIHKHKSPRIFFPKAVNEVLDIYNAENQAVLWAGGTRIADSAVSSANIQLPQVMIALSGVEELSRIVQSSQALEIGAMVNLERIARISQTPLLPGMNQALSGIGTPPIRCRASIGGHIISTEHIGDLLPLLHILDATVETRYRREKRGRRKAPTVVENQAVISFAQPKAELHRGTIITKVIIPAKNWSMGEFLKLRSGEKRSLILCAIIRMDAQIIADFRMALCDTSSGIFRDRELETSLEGRLLPLSDKESGILEAGVQRLGKIWPPGSFDKQMLMHFIRGFLGRL